MYGRLAVSVIEARDVDGDNATSEQQYYVKLRLSRSTHKTASASGSNPRFLKDVVFEVKDPQTEALSVELCQVGPHGDLVVGSTQLPVTSLTGSGNNVSVQWLPLASAGAGVGARLCMVFRYASIDGAGARSPSPTRLPGPPRALSMSSLRPEDTKTAAPAPVAPPAATAMTAATKTAAPIDSRSPSPRRAQSEKDLTAMPCRVASEKDLSATAARRTVKLVDVVATAAASSPQRSFSVSRAPTPPASVSGAATPTAPPASALRHAQSTTPRRPQQPESPQPTAAAASSTSTTPASATARDAAIFKLKATRSNAAPTKATASGSNSKTSGSKKNKAAPAARDSSNSESRGRIARVLGRLPLPVPLAAAGGLLLGAAGFLWHQRDVFYEVQDADVVCTVGACLLHKNGGGGSSSGSNTSSRRRRQDLQVEVIPDVILPGDRLRLK